MLFAQFKLLKFCLLLPSSLFFPFPLNPLVFQHHLKFIVVFALAFACLIIAIKIKVGVLVKRVLDIEVQFDSFELLVVFKR